jgi:hypothetical protein
LWIPIFWAAVGCDLAAAALALFRLNKPMVTTAVRRDAAVGATAAEGAGETPPAVTPWGRA